MNIDAPQHGLPDTELVTRARGGSLVAFGELVERYQDRVYNTCYRMSRSHHDAADLTQTALLRAFESLGDFRGGSSFYTWLFRITVNLVLSHRRQMQRREPVVTLDSFATPRGPRIAAVADDPACAAEQAEQQAQVATALAALDESFRIAVVLKDIEGLDYHEIAEVLAVPVGTVKSRIHRGRMQLKELLSTELDHLEQAG